MNSAIEVKDTLSEDLPLDEDYLQGVDFNIEATDEIEHEESSEYVEHVDLPEAGTGNETAINELSEDVSSAKSEEVPKLNGIDRSPEPRKKRLYQRKTAGKTDSNVIVKLQKLSPRTIAKHTTQCSNGGGELVAPKKRTVNGPNFLRNKLLKKKVGRRKAAVRRLENVRIKDLKEEPDHCTICGELLEEQHEHVECIRCLVVVNVASARQHAALCSLGTPLKDKLASPPVHSPPSTSGPLSLRSTRASSIRSVQSTYGPDACGLCGARGLSDELARYLHTHLHHQRHICLICGSMHARVTALLKHLQAVHGKEDRYYDGADVIHLGDVVGRASILVCTECGLAIHVLDGEAHSYSCKATPRFPLPSQVGYHSEMPENLLAITYPSPSQSAVSSSPGLKTRKKKRRINEKTETAVDDVVIPKEEQLEQTEQPVEPKIEQVEVDESPTNVCLMLPDVNAFDLKNEEEDLDAMDSVEDKSPKKKVKVMLPSHGIPRGLKTLLPGSKGPPPSPPKRSRPTVPVVRRVVGCVTTDSKNLLCGAEEKIEVEQENYNDDLNKNEILEPLKEPSPAPQLPPRDKVDWKLRLEPLLYKLLLRVKKSLRRIQLLHCPVCLRYETSGSNLEDVCQHLKIAHNNHLLRGLGEDTQNKLFTEVRDIYMDDVSNEEAEEYVDANSCRKVLKFCVEPLDKTYSCDLCNVNDLSVKEMVQHLRGAHGFRMYPCLECGQQFKTYGYFISHLASSGKESIYGCRLCGIVGMVSLYMLQSHLRTHSLCDICHTCFESQTALRKHMFNHQQDSPYACTVCQVSYKNYESLEMHLLWKHGTESKPCPTCQEKTWLCTYHFCPGTPADMAEVMENPCVCTVCRLEFSKASMLKVHTRLHTGERPHKCHSCKKSFISKKLLDKHTIMKHSEAALNQAAVAQAAANEIKLALEKSGLKPKKVQQELLKLIGQQNAAKRSAASSRRVSVEDILESKSGDDVNAGPKTSSVDAYSGSTTENGCSRNTDSLEAAAPLSVTSRVSSSIFDIEEEEIKNLNTNHIGESISPSGEENKVGNDLSEKTLVEGEKNSNENLLDLLASAATSQQPEVPAIPIIPKALVDHDYCMFGEPPPEKLRFKSPKKIRRHNKKHHGKKEPRYVLNLSSSSSDEEEGVNGKKEKVQRSMKFGKIARLSDSESSCCDSNCSCSSTSSSSSNSSGSSSTSTSSSGSSSSSSDSEEEVESTVPPKPVEEEVDVDVENHSEPSSESSSDPESGVESDADVSVHESDLETSDSDSENKKRMRISPKRTTSKKRKKKKKKRSCTQLLSQTAMTTDLSNYNAIAKGVRCLPSSTTTVDDIINAVATGLIRSVHNEQTLGVSTDIVGSRRSRSKRKRTDDVYWYEEDNIDDMMNSSKKKKITRTITKFKSAQNHENYAKSTIISAPPFEDPDRLYCYCRCPYDEVSQMIGCDANDCPYEWFHFECVGISEAPDGQWYCPECRLRPKYRAQFDEPFFQPPPPPQQII